MTVSRYRQHRGSETQTADEVWFTVAGRPTPQGSKRAFVNQHTGRPAVVESAGQPLKDWRADVRGAAARVMEGPPWEGPVLLSVIFTLPKPKSAPKKHRTWPDKRPDLDKLLRSTLDALTGIVFADDSQVVLLEAGKDYAGAPGLLVTPGARIIVRKMTTGYGTKED